MTAQLLEAWGVGPSKARFEPQPGFAVQVVREVLDGAEACRLLAQSRLLTTTTTTTTAAAAAAAAVGGTGDMEESAVKGELSTAVAPDGAEV